MQIVSAYLLAAASGGGYAGQIPIFENGAFNSKYVPSGISLDNYVQYLSNVNEVNDLIPNLSQYFLTNKILYVGQNNSTPFYLDDDYMTRNLPPSSWPATKFYIPVNRIENASSIKCSGKMLRSQSSQYDFIELGVGAVVDGAMQSKVSSFSSVSDWTEFSINFSSLPYVDYIIIGAGTGSPAYKDIVLEVGE